MHRALAAQCAALVLLLAAAGTTGHAQQAVQLLHSHVRPEVSAGQTAFVGSLPSDQQLDLSIVLPLRNQAGLTSLLVQLYDPSSPNYRHFLSVAQFTEQFGPTPEDYQAVVSFAQANGFTITGSPANRLVVPIRGTIAQVNQAFNVRMNVYQHPTENRTFFSPDREPSLNLSVPVAHIAGLNSFSIPHPLVTKPQQTQPLSTVTGSGPGGSYLASDMRAAYYGGTTLNGNGQAVGILEFGGYNLTDVNNTFTNAGQTYGVPINNVLLDGATGTSNGEDAEQVLDIVQAIGMAPGLSQVRVYIGNGLDDANVLNSMASEDIAQQLSCSWSWTPDDPTTDDVFFEEFAAQGQSFFTASGDDGAFDSAISPFFYPQEDAYVTAVGATHLTTNGAGGTWASEIAWNNESAGSGGGISPDGIALPSWQSGLATAANGGSNTLRNVPDVAMEGDFDNYLCAMGVCEAGYAGTSFAAPRWAGFMALVNQQAVENGTVSSGSGLGFLNPLIYPIAEGSSYSTDLHDITAGNNDTRSQPVWFSAETGYDLVTGWGSANGQDLIDDLAGQQVPGFWILPSAGTLSVNQGASNSTTITVTDAGGFTGNVTLAVTSTLPSGVTASWGTNPTSGTSVLTLTATSAATAGSTTLTITGTSGTLTATTKLTVAVHAPSFVLSASPSSVAVNQGASGTSTITVIPQYGFTGNVSLAVSGLPTGVTASWGTNPTSGSSVLTLTASSTATAATTTLTITGTSGSLTATTSLSLAIHAPSFTLSSAGNVNIGQGSSSTSYVYVYDQYGFTGSVNLSISGLPSGVTASFSSNPTTSSSALTLTVSSSAAVGQYPLTITGTSGSLSATATLNLGVYVPTFTLAGGGTLNIGQGATGTSYIYVEPEYGFTGSVTMSLAGLPSGVTALWNPNPTTGTAILTLTASSSTVAGQYPLTITGTSGSLTATTTLTLGVYAPTFMLSGGGSLNIGQGTSGTSYVYVTDQYGFTGNVNLSVSGLPAGVTASFSPNPTTGSSTVTLTASGSAALGQYPLTITGTSGSKTATTTLTLGVYVPTFTLSGGGSLNIGQGTSGTSYFYVYPQYGFTGSVAMSVAGLPSGVTASFSPNPTTGSSTLTLTASGSAALGQYTLTITGTSGTQTATTTLTLGVYVPTFALSGGGSLNIGQGTTGTSYIYVNSQYGFTGSVNLSVSGLPNGVTASFSPNPTTGSSTLTLIASGSATLGQSTLTITGTSGTQTATTTLTLGVYAPTFTLSGGGSLGIGQGTSGSSYFYVYTQYGFTGSVNLSVSGLPSGVTASFSPNPTTGSSTLTLSASGSAALGQYPLTITGTSGTQTATANVTLTIYAQSFTLYSPNSVTMNEGSTGTSTIYVEPQYGFTGSVNLSVSGLPSGVTASFSPASTTGSSVLTLTASSSAVPGNKTLTITGTSGSLTATTTVSLTINTPSFTLSAAPNQVRLAPDSSQTSTVYVTPANGFTGSVNLAATNLPSGLTASFSPNPTTAGSSVLTLTANSSVSFGPSTVTITGTSGSESATTSVIVATETASAATSTTLTITSSGTPATSVAAGTVVTLTAVVDNGTTPLTVGQVNFCDAKATDCNGIHRFGSAQLTRAGAAVLNFIPGAGIRSYKAIFAGTTSAAMSASSASNLTVTAAAPTTTTLAQSGSAGNYTLTATVSGQGLPSPTGTVSFLDTSDENLSVGSVALGNGKTVLSLRNSQSPSTGTDPWSIAVGDFNDDGIPDLAVANYGNNTLTILLGNGNGTFTATAISPQTGSDPMAVAVGDFNQDGKADLAVANFYSNSVTILLGNGDGTFTTASSPQTGSEPAAIAVGDFNGDGIEDLAVANESSNTVTVLLGNGDGTFTASSLSPQTGSEPRGIVTGDFNGDGILDLAVANGYSNNVTILLGNGNGSFTPAPSPATGSDSYSLAAADFNADGKLDLAVADISTNSVSILLGNGDGTFTASASNPQTGSDPISIVAGDFNEDGKPDLAIANEYSSSATILLGNGDGTFTAGPTPSVGAYPASIVTGNFNGDGIANLAVVNSYANTATILTSQLSQTVTAGVSGISPIGQGSHAVEASYSGDSSYKSSTSATTQLTAQSVTPSITMTPSASSITTTHALTVIVTLSGRGNNPTPTGLVMLTSGSYSVQQTLAAGSTTFSLAAGTLPVGSDTLSATYTPDSSSISDYISATQSASVSVTPAIGMTTATVTATPSIATITNLQSVTVIVTVSGASGQATPTGTINLSSGTYSAQQALSSGTTSFTVSAGTLSSGTNTLTAAYSGDAMYAVSSGTTTVTVAQVVSATSAPAPIASGTSATGTITFAAGSTYNGTMNLTCALSASPAGAQSLPTCSLNPTSVTFTSGGTGTSTFTVNTTAASTASVTWPRTMRLLGLGSGGSILAVVVLFGIPSRRRRWASMLVLLWMVSLAWIGCGGGSSPSSSSQQTSTPRTTAGTYTFAVTGTDTATTKAMASTNITVVVQ